jgi:hypothetical protein
MADPPSPFLLIASHIWRLLPHSPLSHGIPRVDGCDLLRGTISICPHTVLRATRGGVSRSGSPDLREGNRDERSVSL